MVAYRDAGVVGFDIAGAEDGYPPTRHLDAFEYLRRENAHFTIHAGEAFGLPSIWEAIQWCGAERLGHGVRIIDDIKRDPDGTVHLGRLAAYMRDRRVPLEMCPSSNVQTGAAPSIAEHPIGLLRDLGFRVTVNTDNRLMSGTSMSNEMHLLSQAFGYDLADLQWLTINAMKSAFVPLRPATAAHQRRDQARLRRNGARMSGLTGSPRPHAGARSGGQCRRAASGQASRVSAAPSGRHPGSRGRPPAPPSGTGPTPGAGSCRRLAALLEVAGGPAHQVLPRLPVHHDRIEQQATGAQVAHELGGEDPLRDEGAGYPPRPAACRWARRRRCRTPAARRGPRGTARPGPPGRRRGPSCRGGPSRRCPAPDGAAGSGPSLPCRSRRGTRWAVRPRARSWTCPSRWARPAGSLGAGRVVSTHRPAAPTRRSAVEAVEHRARAGQAQPGGPRGDHLQGRGGGADPAAGLDPQRGRRPWWPSGRWRGLVAPPAGWKPVEVLTKSAPASRQTTQARTISSSVRAAVSRMTLSRTPSVAARTAATSFSVTRQMPGRIAPDVDDHVHLVGAVGHRPGGLGGLDLGMVLAAGEPDDGARGDRRREQARGQGQERRGDADGEHPEVVGLGAQRRDVVGGGLGLEQGVVDHARERLAGERHGGILAPRPGPWPARQARAGQGARSARAGARGDSVALMTHAPPHEDPTAAAAQAAEAARRRSPARPATTSRWCSDRAGCRPSTCSGRPSRSSRRTDLPGFAPPAVAGHAGKIRSIRTMTGGRALVFLGRTHFYEGRGVEAVVHGVRTVGGRGVPHDRAHQRLRRAEP